MKKRDSEKRREPRVGDSPYRRILSTGDNRLMLILAESVCLIFPALYYFFLQSFFLLSELVELPVWILPVGLIVMLLFLVLPTFLGVLGMALAMERGESVPLVRMFDCFSGARKYLRALSLSFRILIRLAILFLIGVLIYSGWTMCVGEGIVATLLTVPCVVAELLLWLLFTRRVYFRNRTVLSHGELSLHECAKEAKTLFRCAPRMQTRYAFYWLPRIFISLLTVGVLLIADVLPGMLISYACQCRAAEQMNVLTDTESENIK